MSSYPSTSAVADQFDTGPLSWVMEEIRGALARTGALALSSSGPDADAGAEALRQAAKALHPAHGALQVVDIAGASLLTEAIEDLLARTADGAPAPQAGFQEAIAAACGALTEYLDELLAGAAPQPLKLYPYYRDLQQARGIGRFHPSDLYFPDLAIRPRLAEATTQASAAETAQLRQRFEKALLPLLKSTEAQAEKAAAAGLADVLAEFVRRAPGHYGRAYWWVLHGFAAGVAGGEIAPAVYVKQLFGRINMQLRKLDEPASEVSERLMRDALYFIATAPQPSPRLQQIRQVYGLAPVDEAGLQTGVYGRTDRALSAAALERLQSAKAGWERLAAGELQAAAEFRQDIAALAAAAADLGAAPLDPLLAQLTRIAAGNTAAAPIQALALDVATALLFLESVLAGRGRSAADTEQTAVAIAARLGALASGGMPSAPLQWSGSAAEDAGQRETVAALAAEMRGNLAQIEKLLDEFFSNAAKRTALAPVDGILHQVEGALAILDQHEAMLAVRSVRADVAAFAEPEFEGEPGRPEFQHVARNLGALSFFMESMQVDSEAARTRFRFDAAGRRFVSIAARRGEGREVDVPVIAAVPPADAGPAALQPTPPVEVAIPDSRPASEGANPAPMTDAEAPDSYERERALADADLPDSVDYAATAPSPVQPSDLVLALDDEAVDAELLDIFLGEAVEVLETVSNTLPSLRMAPSEQGCLTTLRRAFHTLKGSGRMVGLAAFGEAAWGVEKTLNLALASGEPASDDLCKLVDHAHAELGAWVDDLQRSGKSGRTPDALAAACEQVANGGGLPEMASAADHAAAPADPGAAPPEAADDDIEELVAASAPFGDEDTADAIDAIEPAGTPQPPLLAQVISFPDAHPADSRADDSIKRIGKLEISVPLHNIYLAETDDLVRLLAQDLAEWRHEAGRSVNTIAVHAAHSLAGSSATVGFVPLQEVAYALERVLQTLARKPVMLAPGEFDALDRAVVELKFMLQRFALGEMPESAPDQVAILVRLRDEIAGRAVSSQPEVQSAVPAFIPDEEDDIGGARDAGEAAAPADVPGAKTRLLAGFAAEAAAPVQASIAVGAASPEPMSDAGRMPRDELDPDLLPVFLEEASDLLPQIQILLRSWQAEPAAKEPVEGLRRLLHTIKGSARMAGAMRLGQQMHDMESRVEQIVIVGLPSAAAFEDLLGRFDVGLYLYDQLQHPDAARLAPDVVSGAVASAVAPATAAARSPSQLNTPLVRVRADVIDRLVNQAGEVSISRSRVENGVNGLQQSLSELTENVTRLRSQLRELEIQAETQISSQMAQSAERGFDPLEFDRFTRLQELSRMIAETVSDVATVQHNLTRGVEQAGNDLMLQSRLTRDLQQDLMRVRMVQFGSIAERLYRVTRQAAKEVDKRVSLDIRGGSVEIDRGVLEKMAGPFEHLLRNAIVHGIESRAQRLAAGKNETGELTVEIRQEGNEVVIRFSDDGQGLDLERIRQKAEAGGLVRDAAALSDAELRELIFHPGFSTAQEITELAGRGIGMDIVRSEASGLGGRVGMDSQRGRGATFMVRLPLTLAVTQVVVLTTGGNTYAVPSVLVEQVQQLKAGPLADAYAQGSVSWRGEQVPLYFLSELLGDSSVAPVTQQYSPLLILNSGDRRVAVHVDEVVGNREVVVKNIGPQLARMPGVAGATVLGSGDIVLILDPVPLAQRLIDAERAAPRDEQAPQAPRGQPNVMVVDDSLTVRRVTQRLLTREGYQVMLAKDGVDALEQLQTVTPHLMLVDIEMPRMDGFDLTRNVRDDIRTRHIPIIMITSRTATKHRNYAMELGVNEYLGKPYRDTDLLEFVAAYTGKSGAVATGS
jgi:chemosensory pili system protein ChpA (sensor histidine kinase/response regulator)